MAGGKRESVLGAGKGFENRVHSVPAARIVYGVLMFQGQFFLAGS